MYCFTNNIALLVVIRANEQSIVKELIVKVPDVLHKYTLFKINTKSSGCQHYECTLRYVYALKQGYC